MIDVQNLERGYELPYMVKSMTIERIRQFSAWHGEYSQHTNMETAKSAGLATVIAQGLMSHCFLVELLFRNFGQDWLEGGKIGVNFIKPVYEGDRLYVKAAIHGWRREFPGTR